jgi:hypothetical protein
MIKSNIPYLRLALERHDKALQDTTPKDWHAYLDGVGSTWRGVQCAAYFATQDINRWSDVKRLSGVPADIMWLQRLATQTD